MQIGRGAYYYIKHIEVYQSAILSVLDYRKNLKIARERYQLKIHTKMMSKWTFTILRDVAVKVQLFEKVKILGVTETIEKEKYESNSRPFIDYMVK